MNDFRKIITDAIDKSGETVYSLCQREGAPPLNTVYTYLRGESDLSARNLAKLFDILGIECRQRRQKR